MSKAYKDLLIWQESIKMVEEIFSITKNFPKEEMFGLVSQMRRCAVSIPSNIAEGSSRYSDREFIRFLNISNGSTAELMTQLQISLNIGYIIKDEFDKIEIKIGEIAKMIHGLRKKILLRINEIPNEQILTTNT